MTAPTTQAPPLTPPQAGELFDLYGVILVKTAGWANAERGWHRWHASLVLRGPADALGAIPTAGFRVRQERMLGRMNLRLEMHGTAMREFLRLAFPHTRTTREFLLLYARFRELGRGRGRVGTTENEHAAGMDEREGLARMLQRMVGELRHRRPWLPARGRHADDTVPITPIEPVASPATLLHLDNQIEGIEREIAALEARHALLRNERARVVSMIAMTSSSEDATTATPPAAAIASS